MLIILKLVSILLALSIVMGLGPKASALNIIDVSAEACVLMYEDGQCVFEKNADDKHLIASTTKIMTAIICIEELNLDNKVIIKPEYCNVEGSSMYLRAGEKYTVEELLYGLLLASGNDAALALAYHSSGGVEEFSKLMNEKARKLGMENTQFANPHGLDARNHYSSAKDMAKLMLYCMENKTFRELIKLDLVEIKGSQIINHNKLLKLYSSCVGGKTGFTAAAGRCLVSCAEKDGMRFVCVTLAAPDDWRDHMVLYDYAFQNYYLRDLTNDAVFQIPLISGNKDSIKIAPENMYRLFSPKDKKIKIKAEVPQFIFAPVKIGETAGKFYVIIDNKIVAQLPLVYAEEAVPAYPCLSGAGVEVS